ncbi:hypothetical protein N824_25315 [Pedobacter sp. V48]|nr:hypothetical protein N824_25315 [Pedobacter sp. V48]
MTITNKNKTAVSKLYLIAALLFLVATIIRLVNKARIIPIHNEWKKVMHKAY